MDELKVVGIDEKGYGKVYKVVMRNPKIPLTAKALYAYFCSYAGSGTTAFPHREKIISDLQFTKNTFTKHLNYLVEAKYIARKRTALGNLYEILLVVPNYEGEMAEAKSMGYGTIPKFAMLDKRLTANAKGIYAYLCSYAGSGHIAYPRRATILRELDISEGKYYRHFTSLVELGYVTPTQGFGEDGRFKGSTYRLNEVLGIDPSVDPDEVQKIAPESDSQKQGYGGKLSDSQKWGYGENEVFNEVFNSNSQKQGYGDGAMSQKPMYGKTVHPKLGHPNTNNRSYNKHSSFQEEEIINTRAGAREGGEEDADLPLTKRQVKEAIGYDYQLGEIQAWGELKEMLGHFSSTEENSSGKQDYIDRCIKALDEVAYQLWLMFSRQSDLVENHGQRYDKNSLMDALKANLPDTESLTAMITDIADKGEEVKDLRAYVKQLVFNLATKA